MKISIDQVSQHATMTNVKKASDRSFASVLEAATKSSATVHQNTAGNTVEPADFTHMTRQCLLDWMNPKIKSGELSLDDTSPLLALTLKMPVSGVSAGVDNQEYVDFMQLARNGITWAQQNNDPNTLKLLQSALSTMQRYQGQGIVASA